MSFKGFHQISLVDYPGKISSVLFVGSCNLTCRYCHNYTLKMHKTISKTEIKKRILEKDSIIDSLVLSGGEPTFQEDIFEILRWMRTFNRLVKLDTNGMKPKTLEKILEEKLVDYVALDIKTSPDRYKEIGGKEEKILESIKIVKTISHEFRTTYFPSLVGIRDIQQISRLVGNSKWYLQQYQETTRTKDIPYSESKLLAFKDHLNKSSVYIR